ncbi:Helix-turn-helix domain protein [compost metagenome]
MPRSIDSLDFIGQETLALPGIGIPYTGLMNIGEWIRAARKAAGINQEQLGESLGVTKGNVSAWENNRHEPSYSQMLKIAERAGWKLPLPGLSMGIADWPFRRITPSQLHNLPTEELIRAEAMVEVVVREWQKTHDKSDEDPLPSGTHGR